MQGRKRINFLKSVTNVQQVDYIRKTKLMLTAVFVKRNYVIDVQLAKKSPSIFLKCNIMLQITIYILRRKRTSEIPNVQGVSNSLNRIIWEHIWKFARSRRICNVHFVLEEFSERIVSENIWRSSISTKSLQSIMRSSLMLYAKMQEGWKVYFYILIEKEYSVWSLSFQWRE